MKDLINDDEIVKQFYEFKDFAILSSGRIIGHGRETVGGNGSGKFTAFREAREIKIGKDGRFQLFVPNKKGELRRAQFSIKKSMRDHFPDIKPE